MKFIPSTQTYLFTCLNANYKYRIHPFYTPISNQIPLSTNGICPLNIQNLFCNSFNFLYEVSDVLSVTEMAEQMEECKKYGSTSDIPKDLSTFLCIRLNDHLDKEKINILCYLFNETLYNKKYTSDLIRELSFQRKLNCHLLVGFLSVCGRVDLASTIQEMLGKEENFEYCTEDFKDKFIIEKELNRSDGFSLSKRSLNFRLLIVDVLLNSNFHNEEEKLIKVGFNLPVVIMEKCQNLLEMFVEIEKNQNVNKSSNDTIEFLIDVLKSNEKAVAKLKKFRNENLHFFVEV